MMKTITYKMFFVSFARFFIPVFAISFIVKLILSNELEYIQLIIIAVTTVLVMTAFFSVEYKYGIKPKLDYLNSSDSGQPEFKSVIETRIEIAGEPDLFGKLQTYIASKWMLTVIDKSRGVIKFRSPHGLSNLSVGAWLNYDQKSGALMVKSFHLGNGLSKRARSEAGKLNQQIQEFINNQKRG